MIAQWATAPEPAADNRGKNARRPTATNNRSTTAQRPTATERATENRSTTAQLVTAANAQSVTAT